MPVLPIDTTPAPTDALLPAIVVLTISKVAGMPAITPPPPPPGARLPATVESTSLELAGHDGDPAAERLLGGAARLVVDHRDALQPE